jgi:hypothetical protein
MLLRLSGAVHLVLCPVLALPNEDLRPVSAQWRPAFDFSVTPSYWLSFSAPEWQAGSHARIRIPGPNPPSSVWMNSTALPAVPGTAGEWDLNPLPAHGSLIRLGVSAAISPARLLIVISPRVHIQGAELRPCPGVVAATIWVRNTLDNTVNVALVGEIQSGRDSVAASSEVGTIPPGLIQPVLIEIKHTALQPASHWELLLRLEKAEEAIERDYTVTENVTFFVPPAGSAACR